MPSSSSDKSTSTTVSSARARAAATLAGLAAEAQSMAALKAIEEEELRLKQRKREYQLKIEIAKAEAEEKALQSIEEQSSRNTMRELFAESSTNEKVGQWLNDATDESLHHSDLAKPVQSAQQTAQSAQQSVQSAQQPVQSVQTAQSMQPLPDNSMTSNLQRKMIDAMQLPKCELQRFDGDPLQFWLFIRSFDAAVGNTSVDDNVKLNRLLHYCTGDALAVIHSCVVMEPKAGYQKARELLRDRFGNDYRISECWVQKLTEGPRVAPGDKRAIQGLADDLRSCTLALTAMGKLEEIDTKRSLGDIAKRMPQVLQSKWRSKAISMLEDTGQYPSINKLVEFLSKQAKEANDPIYGFKDTKDKPTRARGSNFNVEASSNLENPRSTRQKKGASSNGKNWKPKPTACPLCSKGHTLAACSEFMKLTPPERLAVARDKKLCFNCLLEKRHFSRKCEQATCSVPGCQGGHSKMLHDAFQPTPINAGSTSVEMESAPSTTQGVGATSYVCGGAQVPAKIALPVVAVMVRGSGMEDWLKTYALLDPGSNRSFCLQKLTKMLNLKGDLQSMSINTLSDTSSVETLVVSLDVTGVDRARRGAPFCLKRVHALADFPVLCESRATHEELQKFDHLRGIPVPRVAKTGVMLLIGQDAPHLLAPHDVRRGQEGEPYAVKTVLGWTVNGPLTDGVPQAATTHYVQGNLEAQVERFWKLDVGGNLACDSPSMSLNDKKALRIWEQSLHVVDGHYQLAIPFKADNPGLPDDRCMAEKRLASLRKRLVKDPSLHDRYTKEMNSLLERGYAQRVIGDMLNASSGGVWYLPHHYVLSPSKPDKLRVVFDCAAKCQGQSLNDTVLQGPDLMNRLVGVLLRFREGQVALMSDIEQMFHQVGVADGHRDVLRFLWWPGGDMTQQPATYRMTVHPFGGVWSPSCANFALQRTADDHGDRFDQDVAATVKRNFYVDDCLKSVRSEEEAVNTVRQLTKLLACGGFRLTKWLSNRRKVLEAIPQQERAKTLRGVDLDRESLPVDRALGIHWDAEEDTLGISVHPKLRSHTRRGLLSVMCSVYDPLGFVCPYVLRAKLLFQGECRIANKGWDEPLESTTQGQWIKWLDKLDRLSEFQLDRCLVPVDFGDVKECKLHHFSDASKDAYGCVSFVRLVSSSGRIHCSFVMGKSRLAPLKVMTIPRLELSAAVLAVRQDTMLRRETDLDICKSTFWTDSMLVLQYIRNQTKRFHTFVANRVTTIHEASSPEQWRYVNTELNPADDASRGLDADSMLARDRWRNGPRFLWQGEDKWPSEPEVSGLLNKDPEVKREVTSRAVDARVNADPIDKLLNRYSCWLRLRKAVAWLLRFKDWLRSHKPTCDPSRLTVQELKAAELAILKHVQHESFSQEFRDLSMGCTAVRRQSTINNLRPFLDEAGLLRVGGRLRLAPIEEDRKFPLLLPKNHHASLLVVRHAHESLAGHGGKDHVLSVIRRKYWIPKPRTMINRVLRECMLCKKMRAQPEVQRMADLPEARVTPGLPPFSHVGVDCFGPFLVKRGRSREKRYGCLFVCMATRAIHLEVLHSLDTDAFLNGFMRFAARRGVPQHMYSDNGTNFVGGARELQENITRLQKDDKVLGVLLAKQIEWHFNPPAASHMGGSWERQIRTVRKVLAALLQDEILDDEKLLTLFCEVESIVDDRPITPVSDDPADLEALTPSHLLKLRSGHLLPLRGLPETERFRRHWKHVQQLAERFWKRWVAEYLPNLQRRQRWVERKVNIKEGDLVLVVDSQAPRSHWPLARISEVFTGSDGLAQSAKVRTATGTITRPITKLCVLERS